MRVCDVDHGTQDVRSVRLADEQERVTGDTAEPDYGKAVDVCAPCRAAIESLGLVEAIRARKPPRSRARKAQG